MKDFQIETKASVFICEIHLSFKNLKYKQYFTFLTSMIKAIAMRVQSACFTGKRTTFL